MENVFLVPVLLIIIAMLTGIAGLTFLIIGLIQSKPVFWICGSVSMIAAIITGVVGITSFVKPVMKQFSNGIENLNLRNNNYNNYFVDSLITTDNPVDSTYAEAISGFIEDIDNSPVYIKVYPNKDLLSLGIHLEYIDNGKHAKNGLKTISLRMISDNSFAGTMLLTAYDSKKMELGKGEVFVNEKSGEISNINFSFPDELNFSFIKYCTLYIK
jgi:hypothetical protein